MAKKGAEIEEELNAEIHIITRQGAESFNSLRISKIKYHKTPLVNLEYPEH